MSEAAILVSSFYSHQAVQAVTSITGTKAGIGDNELIAAPGATSRIVVKEIMIQNETSTSTTIILKDDSTAKRRCLLASEGDAVVWSFLQNFEWRLTANKPLNLNLSGANSHGYTIDYWTEDA